MEPRHDESCSLQFKGGVTLQVGDEVPTETMLENYGHIKGLKPAAVDMAKELGMDNKDAAAIVSAGEFILESLYVRQSTEQGEHSREDFFFRK